MDSLRDATGYATAAVGVAAGTLLLLSFALLEMVRPRMVAFEPLTPGDEGLVNFLGAGLVLAMVFCVLALAGILRHSVRRQCITRFHLLMLVAAILTPLFVFGDVALLSDIGKQYEHGLSQPEWGVLYTVMAFQLAAIAGLIYAVLFTLRGADDTGPVTRDATVYLLVHIVGAICAGVGLGLTVLNFFYPRPLWMVQAQIAPTLAVLLVPYALSAGAWAFVKRREGGTWLDEKQRQDAGAAASVALFASACSMGLLYLISLSDAQGMVSVLWFPFYAFLSLFIFSVVVLSRSRDSLR